MYLLSVPNENGLIKQIVKNSPIIKVGSTRLAFIGGHYIEEKTKWFGNLLFYFTVFFHHFSL